VAWLADEFSRSVHIAGGGRGAVRAAGAMTGLTVDTRLCDRYRAVGAYHDRPGGVAPEAVLNGRRCDLRADRLAHGLIERLRGQGVMTGRKSEGSRGRVVAEGVLQIELVAHLADERDRMLARSEGPPDGQVGNEPAVVGAD